MSSKGAWQNPFRRLIELLLLLICAIAITACKTSTEVIVEEDSHARDLLKHPSDWKNPWWFSTDPSVLLVHPETGKITLVHTGTVLLCVQRSRFETQPRKCVKLRVSLR